MVASIAYVIVMYYPRYNTTLQTCTFTFIEFNKYKERILYRIDNQSATNKSIMQIIKANCFYIFLVL